MKQAMFYRAILWQPLWFVAFSFMSLTALVPFIFVTLLWW